jgi:radical SAM protein with 4Fe4S-binding SPASM domain
VRRLIGKVRDDLPLRYVALSGGEPLIHPEIVGITRDLVASDLQPIIITNGTLLSAALLRKLPRGIHFEVSLLGSSASLHERLTGNAGSFDGLIRNISRIERHGSYFTLGFVASKINALAIKDTAELAIALGAQGIMFNRVNLSRGMQNNAGDMVPPAAMLEESLGLLQDVVREYRLPSTCSVPIPPCVVDHSKYPLLDFGWCPRGGDAAYYTIGSNGLVRPCNHSSIILGDLRKESFRNIVTSDKCHDFWNAVPGRCVRCSRPHSSECRGGCPAAAAEFYGTPLHVDPIVEYTRKAGGQDDRCLFGSA